MAAPSSTSPCSGSGRTPCSPSHSFWWRHPQRFFSASASASPPTGGRGSRPCLIPALNLFQSLPHFAYLIPVVVFFGIGQHAGAIATIVFAAPPMARMTLLGLKGLPPSVHEAATMSGCTPGQSLRYVEVPTARDALMVGVNQVIMQCLAMVVIASFIGASGLGYKLLLRLQSLKIGQAFELGISIVLLAIVLDRFSRAWAARKPVHADRVTFRSRWGWPLTALGIVVLTFGLAALQPVLWEMPRRLDLGVVRLPLTLAPPIDALVDLITTHLFDALQAFRGWLLLTVLIPMRAAYLALPWTAVLVLLAGLAFAAGGGALGASRRGLRPLSRPVRLVGPGDDHRLHGELRRLRRRRHRPASRAMARAVAAPRKHRPCRLRHPSGPSLPSSTSSPSSCLFQVNDVSAIAAVMVYAIIPIVRYTIEGVRAVPSTLEEAASMSGAGGLQRLWHVQLPIALPHIMIGINQTVMFSLFMVIIAAFIGTQDLGQEMMRALSANDVGKGLVLGLCVAVMGLTVGRDRLVVVGAAQARTRPRLNAQRAEPEGPRPLLVDACPSGFRKSSRRSRAARPPRSCRASPGPPRPPPAPRRRPVPPFGRSGALVKVTSFKSLNAIGHFFSMPSQAAFFR